MSPVAEALLLSVEVATAATLLFAPLAVVSGLALARWTHPLRSALETVVLAPLVLPPVVTGALLLWLVAPLGLAFTTAAAVLAAGVVAFPLFVRPIRQAAEGIDPGLAEAAATLGASKGEVLRTITWPLLRPGVISGAVLAFARALGEFGATITIAGSIPGSTRTLPLAVHAALQRPGGESEAIGMVGICLVLALGAVGVSEALARNHR
ncbi:MAG: ABC transporter permease subunit [Proteobacteria bacterium]|nr:ABC transporter permease subunit [Pseudomonadota bacterium]